MTFIIQKVSDGTYVDDSMDFVDDAKAAMGFPTREAADKWQDEHCHEDESGPVRKSDFVIRLRVDGKRPKVGDLVNVYVGPNIKFGCMTPTVIEVDDDRIVLDLPSETEQIWFPASAFVLGETIPGSTVDFWELSLDLAKERCTTRQGSK